MSESIRPATASDSAAIARIYNHYILNTVITFEEEAVSSEDMAQRISEVSAASFPWLVAEQADAVVGYAYAGKWKGRCAYRYSAESTIYLDPAITGRGLGTKLYEALFSNLREAKMHTVLGGIALPNPASIALHEKFGLRKAAHFSEIGFKFDRWIDVGYWQGSL